LPPTSQARRRLPLALATAQVVGFAACIAAYGATGLSVAWSTIPATVPPFAIAVAFWWATRRRAKADAALALALVLSFSTLALFMQYPALAAGRPIVDETLLRADAALGISVPDLMAWTVAHPAVGNWLGSAYASLGIQLLIAMAIVAARRDRDTLWEFVTHYHVCLGLAILGCWLWPANEPWTHTQLPDIADEATIVSQIAALNNGTMRIVDVGNPLGLVTMPSFHVAAAWTATWAIRSCRPALLLYIPLNVLLTASTFMLGMHYVVDAVAGLAMLAASVVVYRTVASLALEGSAPLAPGLRADGALVTD
jgi:hypothetical protein